MVGSSGLLASQSTLSVAQMFVDIGALRARDAENHAAVARVLRHWFQFREFRRCRLVKEAMGFNYDRFLFAVAREWSAGRPEWALWRYERFRPDRPTTDFPTTPLSVSSCSRGGGRGFAGSGSERSLDARGIRTARTGLAPAIRCSSAPQTPRRPPVSSGGGGGVRHFLDVLRAPGADSRPCEKEVASLQARRDAQGKRERTAITRRSNLVKVAPPPPPGLVPQAWQKQARAPFFMDQPWPSRPAFLEGSRQLLSQEQPQGQRSTLCARRGGRSCSGVFAGGGSSP